MKSKFIGIFLCVLALVGMGFYPLLAQQISPLNPMNPMLGPLGEALRGSAGQGLGSILSGQPYGPIPQVPQWQPQGGQGLTPGSQSSSSDLSQISPRYCGPVPLTRAPSLPPQLAVPGPTGTIPVQVPQNPQGPWLGSPPEAGGFQESGVFQPTGSQLRSDQPKVSPMVSPMDVERLKERVIQLEAMVRKSPEDSTLTQKAGNTQQTMPAFYEPLSMIEAAFQQVPILPGEARREIRQYGYSLFASPVSTFAPVLDVPVGPDYILGPGDDLIINVWGAMESGVMRTVDRNGQVVLPSVGPVRVWGLSFSQAERLIREQLGRYYQGFQTNVTMGRLRTIRVYVVGEVCQPGSFTLSSLSTVTNALFSAGGPLKLGSLRSIEIKRNHHSVGTLDLYDFLLRGDKTRDFRLESGDTIFVPPVGPVAAITGEVKRPGIYELKGSTRVADIIDMAGGLMPQSYLKRVQMIRNKPNAEREVVDLDLTHLSVGGNGDSPKDVELINGDLVRIYPTDPRIYNTVRLNGAVKYPGEYELKPGMRLTELLRKENFLPESYTDRIEIARLKDDLTTEILSIDMKKAWEGDTSQDIPLRRLDLISVRSEFRLPGAVKLEGEVARPGIYRFQRGERLSSVLKRAGGFTDKAFLKGAVFTRITVQEVEKRKLDDFIRDHEQRLLSEASQLTPVSTGLAREEVVAQQAILTQRREQLLLLASKVTLGRVVISLDELDKLEGSPNDLILEDGDSLKISQKPSTILVMGSVRNPTGILYKEDVDIQYYLNRAGGLTPEADAKGIYLLKTDGSAITGFMRLRDIEAGDVVIVPPSTEAKMQWLPFLKEAATIAGQVAIGLAGLVSIAR